MISEDDARAAQDRRERLAQLEASIIANTDRKQRERLARLEASERLMASIQKRGDEGPDEQALDEAVHDVKSAEAADINNGGFQEQIDFLLDAGFTEQMIREMLDG